MGYRVIYYDEDGEEYRGTNIYDTYEEAEEVLIGSDEPTYFEDKMIAGGHVEKEE